jgi:hypothetical protein
MKTSLLIGIVSGVCVGFALAQALPQKSMPGGHADLFYVAPPEQQVEMYVGRDDRYKDVLLTMSPRDAEGGRLLCTEGDQIIGREDDIVRRNLARLSAVARLIDPDVPAIQPALAGGRKDLLLAMRRLRVGDDEQQAREIAEARLGPWTNAVVGIVTRLEGKTDLIPGDVRAAVRAIQRNPQAHGVGIIGQHYRWPAGVVPYVIRVQGLPVQEAIADWTAKTDRIRLRPYRRSDPAWVEFVASSGCSSYIGKSVARGPQPIMLANGCGLDQIVHEIGHAIGFFHEQSRLDRDRALILHPQNMIPGTEAQFAQVRLGQAQDFNQFDFTSVMLYGPSAFSANGQPTMTARDPAIGQNWGINHRQNAGLRGLSRTDVESVSLMYPEKARED